MTSTLMGSCPACRKDVDITDRFCRICGHSLRGARPSASEPAWYHRKPVVLLLLFLLLGPLALRLLWSSPEFSIPERVLFTILSILEIVLLGVFLMNFYVSSILSLSGLEDI